MADPAYSASCGRQPARKPAGLAWIDRALGRVTGLLPAPMRLLMIKDLRLFRRDPAQWSQILIFFGLLALYFINVRQFSYDIYYAGWINMVSFLNLAVVGFDDTTLAEHAHPSLTTVRQPIYEIARRVCHMLVQILSGEPLEADEREVLFEPKLVIRDSSSSPH